MSVGLETTAPVTQGKRRRVLWLQRSLLAVLAYLTLLHDPVRGFGLDELGVIALAGVTVLISVLPTKYFAGSGLDFALLLCNLSATAIPVVLSPETAPAPSFLGHPVNGEVGTWFGAFRIPNLVPRSLVNIVGCSSRGRGNCGKLRATSNWASKPVIRSFPSAVRTVEKQLRALASSPPELVVFPRFA